MLDAVADDGVVAGNPLKEIVGPLVVVTLFRLFTERLVMADEDDPRLATVWMGTMNEEEVQAVVELTSAVFVTPVLMFLIVPLE